MIAPISGPIDLTDKVAIVTGASRGIGRATSVALAREGANIAACDVLPCEDTIADIQAVGRESLDIQCDVLKKVDVQKAVDQVIHAWDRIDILVSNAAILGNSSKELEEYTQEEWDLLLQTNLRGTFLMIQAVWPYMKKQGSGKVVCLGSIAGRIGGVLAGPHYCASKGGIHALVKWAAKKGERHGIYVNGIAPGPIATPMTINEPYKDEMVPLGRLGQPQDIAEVVVFLASQASNFITGNIIDVNGGILMV
ncbi:MAG: SDR family oxidoreductase [Deltaproteobacteria bacterium]|nr:SDR family oxidoreductase [Deltaproteobacteria bacterium]